MKLKCAKLEAKEYGDGIVLKYPQLYSLGLAELGGFQRE